MIRIENIQKKLGDLDAFVIESPIDLYYATGMKLSTGTLVVGRKECQLFVDGRYIEVCQTGSIPVQLTRAEAIKNLISQFANVGFDSAQTSYERYLFFQEMGCKWIAKPHFVQWIRAVKDVEEVKALRKAASLAIRGYHHIRAHLQEGVTETDLVCELKLFWLKEGGEEVSFDPIIAFGLHTAMPHYHPSDYHLKRGMPVLFDMGVQVHRYQSDLTRVDFFGDPNPKLQEIYEIVREAKAAATKICRHGVPTEELDEAARDVIEKAGYGEHFVHNLGHGVGLEVHEMPRLRKQISDGILKTNMVITIEPGIYLPGIGGVRLEDTLLVTESGCETLTSTTLR